MSKVMFLFLCLTLMASVITPAYAAVKTPDALADGMIGRFQSEFEKYEKVILNYAKNLFYLLFLAQFSWAVLQLFLQESLTFGAVIACLVRQIMMGGFFWWLLVDRTVTESIVASFSAMSGMKLDLANLLRLMVSMCASVTEHTAEAAGVFEGFYIALVGLVTSVIMSFALTTAIGYLAIVMLENYIVSSLGLILLGFGGSEYTRNYALSYIKTLFHIGFKLFLVTVILMIGFNVFYNLQREWTDATLDGMAISNTSLLQTCMSLIAASLFFWAIIKVVPQIADTLIAGVSMGIGAGGAAIRSGVGGAAALAGGLAMGAGRVAAGTIGTAGSATGAAANAYHASRQSGKSVGRAVSSAFGSALGHSILGVGATAQNVFRGVRNNLADHGILRGHGPQADTVGAAKRQGAGVWSRHKELRAVDEMKQQNSMSAPGAGAAGDTPAQAASGTQRGGSRQDFSGIENVSSTGKEALKAPTAEELSKRLGVGGDVNHA